MMIKTRKAVFKHQVKRLTKSQSFLLARKWKITEPVRLEREYATRFTILRSVFYRRTTLPSRR